MKVGDKIIYKQKKTIYLYLENENKIIKHKIPIIPRKTLKEMKEQGFFPLRQIYINGEWHKPIDLDNIIHANSRKDCLQKVKYYFMNKIREVI